MSRHLLAVALCAGFALCCDDVVASIYVVDGGCPSSGTGTTLACGPDGPFKTVSDGIQAMMPGDTLNIRGAHDGFDGVYFEQLTLHDGGPLPGKALACTANERCVIQGCRAPVCPTNEQPAIRGMTLRTDWVDEGGGVHRRVMEATPEPDGLERDLFDPHLLMQGSATPLTMLAYAGDDVTSPADGQWSYEPATQSVRVNPLGDVDPAAEVFVPHYAFNVHLQDPSANVTLQYLTFEGTRGRSIKASASPPHVIVGLVFRHLTQRYVPRHFIITNDARGLLIEQNLAEYGCRGVSWAAAQSDGCFGYRLFGAHNSVIRDNVLQHFGATGRQKLSGGLTGWPCPWCDAPWNDPEHTDISTFGVCINVKQTEGSLVQNNQCEDTSFGGVFVDVSRGVTVAHNTVRRTRKGITLLDFTPTNGCPTTDPAEFCYNSDHVIHANVIDEAGLVGAGSCAIDIDGGSERHTGGVFLAQVYNNLISHPGFGGICLTSSSGTATSDVSILHNTVYGSRDLLGVAPSHGLVLRDPTSNVLVQNNVFDGLTGDALVIASGALDGVSLDGDVLGTVGGCEVSWNVPAFSDVPSGGTCDTLTAFAAANPPQEGGGSTGALLFADVTAMPPDLHLTAGSAAIDAGVASSVDRDFEEHRRPFGLGWDAGADEFNGGVTTTVTFSSTSTSRPTSTSTTSTTLPPLETHALSGAELLMKDSRRAPTKRRLVVDSRDVDQLTLDTVADIPALLEGDGTLKVITSGIDTLVKVYPLQSLHWKLLDRKHPERGFRYKSKNTPIKLVQLEAAKRLLVRGSGGGLVLDLAQEPSEVRVELRMGLHVFCLAFGGEQKAFVANRKLVRTSSERAIACPIR